ncbi:MAG TPA: hypothetical protein VF204_20505 [Streptosporangiaceae bacterium]
MDGDLPQVVEVQQFDAEHVVELGVQPGRQTSHQVSHDRELV